MTQITWEESEGYVYITRRFSSRSAAQAGVFALLGVEELPPAPTTDFRDSPEYQSALKGLSEPAPIPDESQLPPHADLDSDDNQGALKHGEAG